MNQKGDLHLDSGRSIWLRELRQSTLYEGLLEGLPTTEMNQRIVEGVVEDCGMPTHGAKPFLIQPTEKPVKWGRDEPYPFGNPAELPRIKCVARFYCPEPARDQSKDFSELVVVWFQEEFAFPIDPQVLKKLQAIYWEELAGDFDY